MAASITMAGLPAGLPGAMTSLQSPTWLRCCLLSQSEPLHCCVCSASETILLQYAALVVQVHSTETMFGNTGMVPGLLQNRTACM